jgi:hypothetical protein
MANLHMPGNCLCKTGSCPPGSKTTIRPAAASTTNSRFLAASTTKSVTYPPTWMEPTRFPSKSTEPICPPAGAVKKKRFSSAATASGPNALGAGNGKKRGGILALLRQKMGITRY